MNIYHQGDVAFISTTNTPGKTRRSRVLVQGTHTHSVKGGKVFETEPGPSGLVIAMVQGPCTIVHSSSPKEHDDLVLPEGLFEVRRQRELSPTDDPMLVVD